MFCAREVKILKEVNLKDDLTFRYDRRDFMRDNHLQTFLSRVFGVRFAAVFAQFTSSSGQLQPHRDAATVKIDATDLILFKENGEVIELTNSEWGHITLHNRVAQSTNRDPEFNPVDAHYVRVPIRHGCNFKTSSLFGVRWLETMGNKKIKIEIIDISCHGLRLSTPNEVMFHHEYLDDGSHHAYVTDENHNEKNPVVSLAYNQITGDITIVCCAEYRVGNPELQLKVSPV
jgi:hypothetical protein